METCTPGFPPGANPNNTVLLNQSNGTYKQVEGFAGASMKSFAITSNTCGASLAEGATCTITIEYIAGQARTPAAENTLWIRSNGAFIAQISLFGFAG